MPSRVSSGSSTGTRMDTNFRPSSAIQLDVPDVTAFGNERHDVALSTALVSGLDDGHHAHGQDRKRQKQTDSVDDLGGTWNREVHSIIS